VTAFATGLTDAALKKFQHMASDELEVTFEIDGQIHDGNTALPLSFENKGGFHPVLLVQWPGAGEFRAHSVCVPAASLAKTRHECMINIAKLKPYKQGQSKNNQYRVRIILVTDEGVGELRREAYLDSSDLNASASIKAFRKRLGDEIEEGSHGHQLVISNPNPPCDSRDESRGRAVNQTCSE
jgi:hypothetical protein